MRFRIGFSLLFLILLQSCTSRNFSTAPVPAAINQIQSKSQSIDNSVGGSVFLPDGAGVQIPAGAFNQNTTVTVSRNPVSAAPGMGSGFLPLKYVYYFNSGGASFAGNVTMVIPYDPADIPGGQPAANLVVIYHNGTQWVTVPSALNTTQKTLTVVTNHFSPWAPSVPSGTGNTPTPTGPTDTFTYTPSWTITNTPTSTPTGTWFTSTPTPTPTGYTPTFTPTDTWTFTPVPTDTDTPCGFCTPTNTPTNTFTWTVTNTYTATYTYTGTWFTSTPTPTPTGTYYTSTFTPTDTWTLTPVPTDTYTPCGFCTPTNTFPPWTPTPTPTGTWYTSTPTPTPTGTYYTETFTPTYTWTLTSVPTDTYTPCGLCTNTPTPFPFTNTPTSPGSPTNTFTITNTVTNTPTKTPTNSPTNTPTSTPTPTGTWFTPTYTYTNCFTFTPTLTGTVPPPPSYHVSGSVTYTGTGTVDVYHPISVGPGSYPWENSGVTINGGTYLVGSNYTGVINLYAVYNFNGTSSLSGERYTNTGSCSSPVTIATFPVTISGPPGTTVIGPNLTIDDTCSYEGFYGNLDYTGNRGTVQYCRPIHIQTFSDPGYTTLMQPGFGTSSKSGFYDIVTNTGSNPTGLTPLYARVWFDANGDGVFDTGDPYQEFGPITPTADGLLQNISFDDTYVK